MIRIRPATPEERAETIPDGSPGSLLVVSCDGDHCTLEERAVIDQAVSWSLGYSLRPDTNSIDDSLFFVVQRLLATRSESEKGKK